ncbi:MAG: tetratricopeptide repeat protein [Chakrabartia sp.]
MALFAVILIGLLVLGLLWRIGGLSFGALCVSGAALSLGLVGYALQGSPNLPSAPVATKPAAPDPAPDRSAVREELIGKVGSEANTLAQADAYLRIDRPDLAARVLRLGLARSPKSPGLWTGLGNAMVSHGKGLLSPAAEYCYRRALQIAPDYPGALYFYALALASNDRTEEARPVFIRFVRQLPMDAPIRAQLVAELVSAGIMAPEEARPTAAAK